MQSTWSRELDCDQPLAGTICRCRSPGLDKIPMYAASDAACERRVSAVLKRDELIHSCQVLDQGLDEDPQSSFPAWLICHMLPF